MWGTQIIIIWCKDRKKIPFDKISAKSMWITFLLSIETISDTPSFSGSNRRNNFLNRRLSKFLRRFIFARRRYTLSVLKITLQKCRNTTRKPYPKRGISHFSTDKTALFDGKSLPLQKISIITLIQKNKKR